MRNWTPDRVRRVFHVAVICGIFLAGCGPTDKPQPKVAGTQASSSGTLLSLPAALEGDFSLSVEKGPVDEKGVSEANFGTLTVNGVEHLVQIAGTVLGAAGLPRAGGKVRATLASRTDQYGPPTYIITAMEKL